MKINVCVFEGKIAPLIFFFNFFSQKLQKCNILSTLGIVK